MDTAKKTPPLQVESNEEAVKNGSKEQEKSEISSTKKKESLLNGISLIKNEYLSDLDKFDYEADDDDVDIDLNFNAENDLKNGAVFQFHPKKLKNKASLRARGKNEDSASEEETSTGKKY